MNPAEAMATFLRVWRQEWAGLSREQLAVAVSAGCGKGKDVTARIVRKWESGQPPKSTAELNALTKVMRRHPCGNPPGMGGMSRIEIDQFRKAVVASCGARQYPELFQGDPFPYRKDADEIAVAIYGRGRQTPLPISIVQLVASVNELERAVRGEFGLRVSRAQERRQCAALPFLRARLEKCHGQAGRLWQAVAVCGTNAGFIEVHFGPRGLGGGVSVMGQRHHEALAAAQLCSWLDRPAAGAQRLLRLSDQASAKGDKMHALSPFFDALTIRRAFSKVELGAPRDQGKQLLPIARERGQEHIDRAHYALFRVACAEGLLDQAESHLAELAHWKNTADPVHRRLWETHLGDLAAMRRDWNDAHGHFEQALSIARRHGLQFGERKVLQMLKQCDDALSSRCHISVPPNGTRRKRPRSK